MRDTVPTPKRFWAKNCSKQVYRLTGMRKPFRGREWHVILAGNLFLLDKIYELIMPSRPTLYKNCLSPLNFCVGYTCIEKQYCGNQSKFTRIIIVGHNILFTHYYNCIFIFLYFRPTNIRITFWFIHTLKRKDSRDKHKLYHASAKWCLECLAFLSWLF